MFISYGDTRVKSHLKNAFLIFFNIFHSVFWGLFILPELWDFKIPLLSLQPEKYLRFRSQINGLNWNTTLMRNETYKKFLFEDFPQNGCTNLSIQLQPMRVPTASYLCQEWALSLLFLNQPGWKISYCIVVLTCITLITNETEHIVSCLLVIWV